MEGSLTAALMRAHNLATPFEHYHSSGSVSYWREFIGEAHEDVYRTPVSYGGGEQSEESTTMVSRTKEGEIAWASLLDSSMGESPNLGFGLEPLEISRRSSPARPASSDSSWERDFTLPPDTLPDLAPLAPTGDLVCLATSRSTCDDTARSIASSAAFPFRPPPPVVAFSASSAIRALRSRASSSATSFSQAFEIKRMPTKAAEWLGVASDRAATDKRGSRLAWSASWRRVGMVGRELEGAEDGASLEEKRGRRSFWSKSKARPRPDVLARGLDSGSDSLSVPRSTTRNSVSPNSRRNPYIVADVSDEDTFDATPSTLRPNYDPPSMVPNSRLKRFTATLFPSRILTPFVPPSQRARTLAPKNTTPDLFPPSPTISLVSQTSSTSSWFPPRDWDLAPLPLEQAQELEVLRGNRP